MCFPGHEPGDRDRVLAAVMEELVQEPWKVAGQRGVQAPPAVRKARAQADSRWWGKAPHGPAPMEKPFEGDELGRLVATFFDASPVELVQYLPASQALAAELAMLNDASPELVEEIAPSLMTQMDALERAWLRMPKPADLGWYMGFIEARVS
jgi:hypothetical protein